MPGWNFRSVTVVLWLALALALFSVKANPIMAQGLNHCDRDQEIFGFELKQYPIEHQVRALLDISIEYRFITTRPLQPDDYPNYVPIAKDIEKFLVRYPNETDFWEILNHKLVNFLLDKYPTIGSLRSRIDVRPTLGARYPRHSTVLQTRPDNCPLMS